ncbi:hypothetical protein C8R47DRAFT_1083243 [Mycena vitilis]|nr:hypothetical protein C8R47DRAFT_1083243 [Mycena vitilis]
MDEAWKVRRRVQKRGEGSERGETEKGHEEEQAACSGGSTLQLEREVVERQLYNYKRDGRRVQRRGLRKELLIWLAQVIPWNSGDSKKKRWMWMENEVKWKETEKENSTYSDNGRHKCEEEVIKLEERRIEVVEEVDVLDL